MRNSPSGAIVVVKIRKKEEKKKKKKGWPSGREAEIIISASILDVKLRR